MGNSLQEYVIRLGAQVDNGGVNQILSLLDSSKLKALGVSAALTAATTAVYKFVESATKKEFELRQLAKTQNKNVESLRAQNTALKAMGMTLKDIEKDESLKKIYKDISKFNEELELPNMDRALENVRNLQGAFWQLKSVVNYAVQAIGDKVLINLEMPIKRITQYLGGISGWFKKNFESISSRVATVMSSFARGVLGVFEGFKQIGELVGKLPAGIQAVGSAILSVTALIKSGPVGQLLALVGLVGDVIRDYENFQWNRENGLKAGDERYVQTMNDSLGIWDIFEGNESGQEKFNQIAFKFIDMFTDSLNSAWASQEGQDSLGKMFLGENQQGGLIGGAINFLKDKRVAELGSAFINFITDSIREVGGFFGGAAGGLINALFGADENGNVVVPESVFKDKTTGTTFATGLGTFFAGFIGEMKQGKSLFESFKSGLGQGALGTLLSAIVSNTTSENGEINIDWEQTGVDITTVGATFIDMVSKGIGKVKDIGKTLFTAIGGALSGQSGEGSGIVNDLGEIVESWGKDDSVLGNAITLGITGWFSTGSLLGGILTGLGSVISDISSDPENLEKLKTELNELGKKISELLVGSLNEETGEYEGGILQALGDLFSGIWETVSPMLDPLWEGIKNGVSTLGSELWGLISPYIDFIIYQISSAISNSPLGQALIAAGILGPTPGSNTYGIDKNGNVMPFSALSGQYSDEELIEASKKFRQNKAAQVAAEKGLTGGLNGYYIGKDGSIITPERMKAEGFNPFAEIDFSKFNFENAFRQILNSGDADSMRQFAAIYSGLEASGGQNYLDARKATEGLLENLKVNVDADTSQAESKIDALSQKKVTVGVDVETQNAYGGRFGSERNNMTVGEDGPEYIIPITKTDRAISLINQMLGEMGSSAVNRIFQGLGLGKNGTVGASTAALETAMTGMTANSTYNITAPININVNASGANAKEIGSEVYNLAERNLIKNLTGVFG